jgi:Ca2+-binding RTX toxin-like protein
MNSIDGGRGDDRIAGMDGIDKLYGGDGIDILYGGLKNDVLSGDAGDDWLYGGMGYDRVAGGAGADSFVFAGPGDQTDTVVDFSRADGDVLVLDSSAFGGLSDQFRDGDFLVASTARKAASIGPWLLYNTTTGNLSYDADGSGPGASVLIATLANKPDLDASDFVFV